MNETSSNPYAPPQAETLLDVAPFSLTYAQHILLWVDLVLMLGAAAAGGGAAVATLQCLVSNSLERVHVSSRMELPAREYYFFAAMIFLPMGIAGLLGGIQAMRGSLQGRFATNVRVFWCGAMLVGLAILIAWAKASGSASNEETIWLFVGMALFAGWWLLHWLTMRDIARRIAARHDLRATVEDPT